MIAFVDNLLNRITMYRLVLYYLIVLLFLAFVFGFFGIVPNEPIPLIFTTIVITIVSLATNWIFVRIFKVQANVESVYITALILALIVTSISPTDISGILFLVFLSIWAISSKYIFAIGKKHIFNPVAIAVVLTAFTIGEPATWWIGGNLALLPFVLVGGLLVVRKLHRFDMVISFFSVAFLTIAFTSPSGMVVSSLTQTALHSSILFLAFAMLTEPLTTPPTTYLRILYGGIVGLLFAPAIHIGSFYLTPELGLLIGNLFAYIVSPKGRHMLTLTRIEKQAKHVYDFVFTPDKPFSFRPGQYLEWTLGHNKPDSRGNRRYFTIASSPTEKNIRLGVKFYEPPSTFKKTLAAMKEGDVISASHLSGNFVLPKNKKKGLVFIAGGIGITPFRSMVQYLIDNQEHRSIVILYANRTQKDIAYKEIFDRAEKTLGIRTIYTLSDEASNSKDIIHNVIDAKLIAQEIPDYRERIFYISGPHRMVTSFQNTLGEMGISRLNIKSDFFPGFA